MFILVSYSQSLRFQHYVHLQFARVQQEVCRVPRRPFGVGSNQTMMALKLSGQKSETVASVTYKQCLKTLWFRRHFAVHEYPLFTLAISYSCSPKWISQVPTNRNVSTGSITSCRCKSAAFARLSTTHGPLSDRWIINISVLLLLVPELRPRSWLSLRNSVSLPGLSAILSAASCRCFNYSLARDAGWLFPSCEAPIWVRSAMAYHPNLFIQDNLVSLTHWDSQETNRFNLTPWRHPCSMRSVTRLTM
jgi:hypothetical protein